LRRIIEVPRGDCCGDAHRLADGEQPAVVDVGGDYLSVKAFTFFGVPLDESCAVKDFATRLGQRLALFGSEDGRQVIGVRDDQVVPAPQDPRAFDGRHGGPLRAGGLRLCDRAPDVHVFGLSHLRDHRTRRRVRHVGSNSALARYPAAADEEVGPKEFAIPQSGRIEARTHDTSTLWP
jgi:hypothetical protein